MKIISCLSSYIVFAGILVFSGCGITPPSIVYDSNGSRSELIQTPSLDQITIVEVGENMYTKSFLYYDNTYVATLMEPLNEAYVRGGLFTHNINLPVNFKSQLMKWTDPYTNTICNNVGPYYFICLTDRDGTGSFNYFGTMFNGEFSQINKPIKYKIERSAPYMKDKNFKREVLYQGKVNNKINLSFLEFKDNLIRPAFTQNIEYELDKNGQAEIGFKGLRIQVLKATNFDITYKVIKDYN